MYLLLTLTGRAPQSSIFFSASTGVILQFVKKAIRVSATKQENAVGLHCVSAGSTQKKHYNVHKREQDRFRCAYGKSWGAVGVKVSEMYVKEISLPSKRSVHFNCEKREVFCTQWRWKVGKGEGEGFTKSFIGSIQYDCDTLFQTQIYDSPYPILVLPQTQIFCSNLPF